MYRVGAGSDRLAKTLRPKKEQLRVDLSAGRLSPRVRQELLNRGIVARENMAQELALSD